MIAGLSRRKAATLHREITAQGFTGGYGIVRAFVEQHHTRPDLTKVVKPQSVRQVTGWICSHPEHLDDVNRIKMIKQQMYGRAGFDLLRKRVLLCP